MEMREALYGAEYYSSHCGTLPYERNSFWLNFFGRVADELIRGLQPKTVFDAGCAHGFLVESLWDRGVETCGRDLSSFAISKVRSDIAPYCSVGSITEPFPGRYDLVTCIEVLEHLPEDAALEAIDRMCEVTSTILFSSSPTDLTEPTHINVKPPIYWLSRFAERGFAPDYLFDASFLAPHAFVLRKFKAPPEMPTLQLFAQFIRLRMALVEREQRIGRFGEEFNQLEIKHQSELRGLHEQLATAVGGLSDSRAAELTGRVAERLAEIDRLVKALNLPVTPPADAPVSQTDHYVTWSGIKAASREELILERRVGKGLSYAPTFSILVPIYKVPVIWMEELIESVRCQSYENWELCFAFGDAESTDLLSCIERHVTYDPRIKLKVLASNGGISRNSNAALELASGEWAVLLDHDDTLAPNALFELARALNDDPNVAMLYSDKDQLDVNSRRTMWPLFKPQWSPEMMLNANYLTHISAMRVDRLRQVGGWDPATDGAQDWDVFLRVIGREGNAKHVPHVLYHWRQAPTSVAAGGLSVKPYAANGQLIALTKHLPEAGWPGANPDLDRGEIHINWSPHWRPSVSVISFGENAASELKHLASKNAFQFIPVTVDAEGKELDAAVARATGDVLIVVDARTIPLSDDVFDELIGPLQNPAIALVSGQTINSTEKIVDFGFLFEDGMGRPLFRGHHKSHYGLFGGATWYRNVLAASSSCLAFRKELWRKIGPFGIANAKNRPDVGFCLRATLGNHGRLLLNPYAKFRMEEPGGFEQFAYAQQAFAVVQARFPAADPYFHPALEINAYGGIQIAQGSIISPVHDYAAEARIFAGLFNFDREDIRKSIERVSASDSRELRSMAWFVPDFDNPFYGGLHTILRVADFALRERGIEQNFVVVGGGLPEKYSARIGQAFPALRDGAKIYVTERLDDTPPIGPVDAAIATLWTTALPVLRMQTAHRKFHFLQDWEPLFYPAGSLSAMVEATYRFGFHAICNTVSLAESYRNFGGKADNFVPATDPEIFYARRPKRASVGDPITIFCYARPGHPRNCFEVLTAALRDIKEEYGSRVDIVTAGAEWDPVQHGLVGTIRHLGLLSYPETGALYRAIDIGLVAMSTRHPSYLPFELMACGAHVVTNRNPHTAWLLQDGINCTLFEAVRGDIAAALGKAIDDENYRLSVAQAGATLIQQQYSDWQSTCSDVCDLFGRVVSALPASKE